MSIVLPNRLKTIPLVALAVTVTPAWAAKHGLLIGVSEYEASGLHNLPGTREDIQLMDSVLRERFGFRAGEITVLQEQKATHQNIEQAFSALAQQVQPGDFVYIHYSGHGSYTKDQNGDEQRSGEDQTLVSYGSRGKGSKGLDRYDILDDELNRWLKPIVERVGEAGEVVYVSDSCHSATNTRGEHALVARAAPPDTQQDHPRAKDPMITYDLDRAVTIGAARDDESAQEFKDDGGKSHGVFTWYWERSLRQAKSGETWQEVFDRARMWVSAGYGESQHPRLTGKTKDRPVFGGKLPEQPAVLVKSVRDGGKIVALNIGRLSGATVGSIYASREDGQGVKVKLTQLYDAWSNGEVQQGQAKEGDILVETEHVYTTQALKVYLGGPQQKQDAPLVDAIKGLVKKIPGYALVADQSNADRVLYVVRPRRKDGAIQYRAGDKGRDTLPEYDAEASPEVWVLTASERILHENLNTSLADKEKGLATLQKNLERHRRVRELQYIAQEGTANTQVVVRLITYERCAADASGCIEISGGKYRRQPDILPITELKSGNWRKGDLVSFELFNSGHLSRYVYLLDVAPDGKIEVIYPPPDMDKDAAILKGYERLALDSVKVGDVFDQTGEQGLLILETEFSIDPTVFTQAGYGTVKKGATRGGNPLERFATDVLYGRKNGIRGKPVSISTGSWGTGLVSWQVKE